MKYLSQYLEEKQNALIKELGVFFAFSNKQFEEAMDPKVEKYVRIASGCYCPKPNVDQFVESHDKVVKEAIAQDLKENGKKGVIHRELGNHEYSYTRRIDDTVQALQGYDITEEDVRAETGPYMEAYHEWEERGEWQAEAQIS